MSARDASRSQHFFISGYQESGLLDHSESGQLLDHSESRLLYHNESKLLEHSESGLLDNSDSERLLDQTYNDQYKWLQLKFKAADHIQNLDDTIKNKVDFSCSAIDDTIGSAFNSTLVNTLSKWQKAKHKRQYHFTKIPKARQLNPEKSFCSILLQGILLLFHFLLHAKAMEPVYPEPVFLPRLLNVTVRPGGRVVLPCAVHYLGTKQVSWKRLGDDHFLSIGDHLWVKDVNLYLHYNEITPEVTEWNLVIKNASQSHSGTYECKISDLALLARYVHLQVSGTPVIESATPPPIAVSGKNYVERGQAIHLFCNTTGPDGAHLTIDWFKDGDRIDYMTYKQVVITNYNLVEKNILVSELLIDRSQASDTGTYICRSSNGHIESIKVTVLFADNTNNVKRDDVSEQANSKKKQEYSNISISYVSNEESSATSLHECLLLIIVLVCLVSLHNFLSG